MKKEAVAKLCTQTYKQQGCLTSAELAVLLKIPYTNCWKVH